MSDLDATLDHVRTHTHDQNSNNNTNNTNNTNNNFNNINNNNKFFSPVRKIAINSPNKRSYNNSPSHVFNNINNNTSESIMSETSFSDQIQQKCEVR